MATREQRTDTRHQTPYITTKPFHKSQHIVDCTKNGSVIFEIEVAINFELQREFLGFANGIRILEPKYLANIMQDKLAKAAAMYG
jgi:predicted DNA-binding transcriptional regulator YafY